MASFVYVDFDLQLDILVKKVRLSLRKEPGRGASSYKLKAGGMNY